MAGDDKTEKPTAKRQRELRKKNSMARSQELPAAVSLLAAVVALPIAARNLMGGFTSSLAAALSAAGNADLTVAAGEAHDMFIQGAKAIALPVVLVTVASLAAGVLVTRQKPNPWALKPHLASLNPKNGIKRVFSAHGMVEGMRAFVKLAMILVIGLGLYRSGITHLIAAPTSLEGSLNLVTKTALKLITELAFVSLGVGIVDAIWQRRKFGKQSRMTKQEVKDEAKSSEGNPHMKGAIRSKQMKMSRSRMMAAVAGADVVLANPTHVAVALKYEAGTLAPVVVAKGVDHVAQRIKKLAADADVPIVENKPLARALNAGTNVGDVIPVELYRAVAEVLATIFAARRKRGLPAQRPASETMPRPRVRSLT